MLFRHTRKPDITFSNAGRIDLTRRLARMLGLRAGDVIDIHTDSDGARYLYITCQGNRALGRHHAECRPTHAGGRSFRAYSCRLCRELTGEQPRAFAYAGDPALSRTMGVMIPLTQIFFNRA